MRKLLSSFKPFHNLKTFSMPLCSASFSTIKDKSDARMLRHITSPYGGATIGPEGLPETQAQFEEMLPYTMNYLEQEEGIIGIWIDFETDKCGLVPVAIKHGFKYHHAKDGYISMSKWLEKDTPDRMPHYATHYITVQGIHKYNTTGLILSGIVQNKDNKTILLVKAKNGGWRLPGGIMGRDDLIANFIREKISLELGVKSDFEGILGFKEQDIDLWEQPSFNFFANLKASSQEIIIKSLEIEKAEWVTLEESLNRIKQADKETREFIEDVIRLKNINGAREFQQSAEKGELLHDLCFKSFEYGKLIVKERT